MEYCRRRHYLVSGESMTYDARIRYWEEEWLSELLQEALRLKNASCHTSGDH